jgi:hypothetical protein
VQSGEIFVAEMRPLRCVHSLGLVHSGRDDRLGTLCFGNVISTGARSSRVSNKVGGEYANVACEVEKSVLQG